MTSTNAAGLERYSKALMGTFGTPLAVLERGEGSYVWDAEGKRYLDMLGGIAVNSLGHADAEWLAAVTAQAGTVAHVSNFFASEPQIRLAERLLEVTGAPAGSRVFLCNSGTEANEAALKMSRLTGRTRVLAIEEAFHGRSTGSLSLTHKAAYREPFAPLPGEVEWIPANDIGALEAALGADDVAALFIEPIQGEAGVKPLSDEYLHAARELTSRRGTLLIADEVQTGIGRTGTWLALQAHGIQPDIVTLAKGLGGGFPVGAVIGMGPRMGSLFTKGQHGSTFGGNPLAAAASLATLDAIESRHLLEHVKTLSAWLRAELEAIPGVQEVRGEGLLLGVVFDEPIAGDVANDAFEAGFIINAPTADALRLAPALTLTQDEAATFVSWLGERLAPSQDGEEA
jgi:acetylornithine/N-succinyldiaminopimelate aminotransferase